VQSVHAGKKSKKKEDRQQKNGAVSDVRLKEEHTRSGCTHAAVTSICRAKKEKKKKSEKQ